MKGECLINVDDEIQSERETEKERLIAHMLCLMMYKLVNVIIVIFA